MRPTTTKLWLGLALAGLTLCAGCQDLPVIAAGCESVLVGPICEVGKDRQVRLFVPKAPDEQVLVWQGLKPLSSSRTEVEDGVLLRLTTGAGARELRVIVRKGWHVRSRRIKVLPLQTEGWLQGARELWESDKIAPAEAQLQKALAGSLTVRTRAEALGMLGRIRREQQRNAEAKQLLEQALQADREGGLLSNEAKDTFALAALLVQDEDRVQAAEDLLTSRASIFQQVPDLQPWVYLHLATYRKLRGNLQEALEAVEQGRRLAMQLSEEQVLGALRQSSATILQSLGRWAEAREELVGLADELFRQPCLQANALEMQGWLEITAHELKQAVADKPDPQLTLQRVLQLRRERCTQGKPIAATLTNLSRAALVMDDLPKATSWLAQARQTAPEPDLALKQQWTELRGLIALQDGDAAEAEKQFRELLRQSELPAENATAGVKAVVDLQDTPWQAHMGLAKTLRVAGHLAEAEQHFQLAEAFLEHRSLELPLAVGRVSYLGKHEQGTAAYLDLLAEQGRLADALRVMRRARVRGLRALLGLTTLSRLSDEERQRWEAALRSYRSLRQKLDVNAREQFNAPTAEQKIFAEERRRLELDLTRALQTALAVLGEFRDQSLRSPAPDEVLLACHPLPQGWLCLAQRGTRPVQAMRYKDDPAAHGAELIAALADELNQSAQLTVLTYGESLEQLDFARLPLAGQPLEERVAVVYGLDLPSPRTTLSGRQVALLAIDPNNEFTAGGRPQLAPKLRLEAGWQVTEVPSDHGISTEQLLGMLGSAELFVYFGHARVGSQVARRFLQTDTHGGLQAMDILTLQSVPRQALLIACESGLAKEGSGGVAGLGLAQAFLVRGSQSVIATNRIVETQLGKAMAEELLRGGLAGLLMHPAQRLHEARKAVESGAGRGQPWVRGTRAFRVFVP